MRFPLKPGPAERAGSAGRARSRLATVPAVLFVVGALAGCSGERDAATDPPRTTTTVDRVAPSGPSTTAGGADAEEPGLPGLWLVGPDGLTTEAGDEVCFVELNGQLVAEFRTTAPLAGFYRQYLVRIASDRIELCGGLPIWVMLAELKQDRPTGYSFDSLQHTVREQESGDLMVVISKPAEMREFLETALPELGAACDLGGENFKWGAFDRAPQEEADAEAEADAAE